MDEFARAPLASSPGLQRQKLGVEAWERGCAHRRYTRSTPRTPRGRSASLRRIVFVRDFGNIRDEIGNITVRFPYNEVAMSDGGLEKQTLAPTVPKSLWNSWYQSLLLEGVCRHGYFVTRNARARGKSAHTAGYAAMAFMICFLNVSSIINVIFL